jgi:hypothetical protein
VTEATLQEVIPLDLVAQTAPLSRQKLLPVMRVEGDDHYENMSRHLPNFLSTLFSDANLEAVSEYFQLENIHSWIQGDGAGLREWAGVLGANSTYPLVESTVSKAEMHNLDVYICPNKTLEWIEENTNPAWEHCSAAQRSAWGRTHFGQVKPDLLALSRMLVPSHASNRLQDPFHLNGKLTRRILEYDAQFFYKHGGKRAIDALLLHHKQCLKIRHVHLGTATYIGVHATTGVISIHMKGA